MLTNRRQILSVILCITISSCSSEQADVGFTESTDPDGTQVISIGAGQVYKTFFYEDVVTIGLPGTENPLIARDTLKGGVAFGPEETIGYGEYRPTELRTFQADGSILWQAGREGEGPGEFDSALFVEYSESLGWVVFDPYKCRVCTFTDEGLSDETRSYIEMPDSFGPFAIYLTPAKDFWYLAQRPASRDDPIRRHFIYMARWESLEATEVYQYEITRLFTREEGKRFLELYPQSYSVDDDGRFWLNHTMDYQIEVFEPVDLDHWRIRKSYQLKSYDRNYRRRVESTPVNEIATDLFTVLPDEAPAISAIITAGRGQMWVCQSAINDEPGIPTDVYNLSGEYQFTFDLNKELQILATEGDYMLRQDEAADGSPLIIKSRYWFEDR